MFLILIRGFDELLVSIFSYIICQEHSPSLWQPNMPSGMVQFSVRNKKASVWHSLHIWGSPAATSPTLMLTCKIFSQGTGVVENHAQHLLGRELQLPAESRSWGMGRQTPRPIVKSTCQQGAGYLPPWTLTDWSGSAQSASVGQHWAHVLGNGTGKEPHEGYLPAFQGGAGNNGA